MSTSRTTTSLDPISKRDLVPDEAQETRKDSPAVEKAFFLQAGAGIHVGLTPEQIGHAIRVVVASDDPSVPIKGLKDQSPLSPQEVFKEAYSSFLSDKNWNLNAFTKIHKALAENDYAGAKELQRQIKNLTAIDPVLATRSILDKYQETEDVKAQKDGKMPWNGTYDYNRIGHGERVGQKIVLLNWSDLQMNLHRYFAGGCPHTLEGVSILFKHIIESKCPAVVAFHQPGEETSDRIGEYWNPDILKKISLPDGWSWSWEECSSRIIESAPLPDLKESTTGQLRTPQVVEIILAARNNDEKVETHLFHYDGWIDRNPMPSRRLFYLVLTKVLQMKIPPGIPIGANCRGGVGRTGTFICVHYLILMVIDQLKKQTRLEDIQLNVMEMLYTLRVQRRIFLDGNRSLCDVIDCLAEVYEIINRVGPTTFLEEMNLLA
jgi:protein tyrosine phosphatase